MSSSSSSPVAAFCLDVGPHEWLEFASGQRGFGIFHHPAWSRIMAECYGYRPFVVGVRGADGRLAAGVPLMEVGGALRGRRWVGLPFTDHLEPLAVDESSRAGLLETLATAAAQHGIATVEIRSSTLPAPASKGGTGHVLHRLALTADVEQVAGEFSKAHIRGIRKAERSGVTVRIAEDQAAMDVYHSLHVTTRRRQGVPAQPRRFFKLLWRRIIDPGMGFVMLAHQGQTPVAGAVFLRYADVLTYKYGASDPQHLECRPNNILFSHAIRWACEHGFRTLDWGRTDLENEGLRRFKAGWGAVETPLQYAYLGREPRLDGHGVLPGLVGKTIKVAPDALCRLVGEVFYRYAG